MLYIMFYISPCGCVIVQTYDILVWLHCLFLTFICMSLCIKYQSCILLHKAKNNMKNLNCKLCTRGQVHSPEPSRLHYPDIALYYLHDKVSSKRQLIIK